MAATGLKFGATVGDRYRVERVLGHGALGSAYLCRDLMEGDALVVLRTLTGRPGSGGAVGLRQELSTLSRFKHPQLAQLLDFGTIDRDSMPYLVRQYVEGLDVLQGSRDWSVEQILYHMVRICRVLQFLHSQGIVHCRLKPSNVILTGGEGKDFVPRLLDFGLDRFARGDRRDIAHLAYAAPEVLLGHARNSRSDLYSLGVLGYQLLTRRLPFDDEDNGFLIQKQLQGRADMQPVECLDGGRGLAQVLLGLLEKDPEKRPSSAEDVIRLLSAASGRDYSGTLPGSVETYFPAGRFVGREKELAFLQERATRVSTQGRGWTVFLVGESGSGKSRCMEELRAWASLESWRVVEASCLPREDRSYGPYRRILDRARLLQSGQSAGGNESPSFRFDDFARYSDPTQVELSSGPAAGLFRDQVTREVVRLLADRMTLLLLHDFHWADEATVTVLDYLTSDILAQPIFLCVSLRPGEGEGHLARLMDLSIRQLRAEVLGLEPLPLPVIEELIGSITGEALLGKEIGAWVHDSSGGNPFFVEEILKHLVDRGVLKRVMGRWRLAASGFENIEVPASVAEVLRQRLAHLSPGAMAITEWLALLRRSAAREQLQELSSLGFGELDERLAELVARQILREAGAGCFEFRHALISEVIITNLPEVRRRRMHRRISEVIEKHRGDGENLQELAMHLTEGRCGAKAISHVLRAARACRAEFAHESALRFYDYLLHQKKLLSAEQLSEVSIEAADTCCALGNPKRAIRIIKACFVLIDKHEDSLLKANLYVQLSRSFQFLGSMEESELAATRGMALLQRGVDRKNRKILQTALISQLAFCMMASSQPKRALRLLYRFSCLDSKSINSITIGHLRILISGLCWVACHFEEGIRVAEEAIKILEKHNAFHLLPMAYSHLGINLAGMGRFHQALQQHIKAVDAGRRTRSVYLQAQALCNLTECFCRSGEVAAANDNWLQLEKLAREIKNQNLAFAVVLCQLETQIASADFSGAFMSLDNLRFTKGSSLPVYVRALAFYLAALLHANLGLFREALSDLDALDGLVSSETPIYEASLGAALRGRIFAQQGRILDSINVLEPLEIMAARRHWTYQLTIAKIHLAQAYILNGDLHNSLIRASDALRMAKKMPARSLQAEAHLLLAKIALLRIHKKALIRQNEDHGKTQIDQYLLNASCLELQKALAIAADHQLIDISWRANYLLVENDKVKNEQNHQLAHARETLNIIALLEERVPARFREYFGNIKDIQKAKVECEHVVRELSILSPKYSLAIGEIEKNHLRVLFRVSSAINAIRDCDKLMNAIVELLGAALGVERILIALNDTNTGILKIARKSNISDELLEDKNDIIGSIIGQVKRTGFPFITASAQSDPRLAGEKQPDLLVGSIFCAPLVTHGKILGLIYADQASSMENVSESTINCFEAFCNLAAVAIDNALVHGRLMQQKDHLERYLRKARMDYPELVGMSAAMVALKERISLVAESPLDVLICGESGTGKELVARALHRTGRRAAGRFVPVDCGSLSDSLIESELFGYRKGAFTGAIENRAGLIEYADGGIVFLDEISNLSMRLQSKLLRVLQEREIRRIGETTPRKINIQIIAATNKQLLKEIENGKFCSDLYFRLNVMEIYVPPLRERKGDVELLVDWFLDKLSKNEDGQRKVLSKEARSIVLNYCYPGNVRELKNIVEGSYFSTSGTIIEIEHLPMQIRNGTEKANLWGDDQEAWRVYKNIRDGIGRFEILVKRPFINRQIGSERVRQIMHLALGEANGRYRDAFRLLGIMPRKYAIMMQFLKRHGCYLDFRKYRKRSC